MLYRLLTLVIGVPLTLLCRPRVHGAHHLPRRGPVVVAANHLAVADAAFLCLAARRPLTFIAKVDYFTAGGPGGPLMRAVMRALGQIPVDRADPRSGGAALDAARALLRAGGAWAVHPEGTRSPDGHLHRGRTGVMRVALGTDVPVVPVVLRGTDRVSPRGARLWRPARVDVTVLPPLDLAPFRAMPDRRLAVRLATDHLMGTIAAHSPQRYVDVYAAPGGGAGCGAGASGAAGTTTADAARP